MNTAKLLKHMLEFKTIRNLTRNLGIILLRQIVIQGEQKPNKYIGAFLEFVKLEKKIHVVNSQ